jgi:hypothetical protein
LIHATLHELRLTFDHFLCYDASANMKIQKLFSLRGTLYILPALVGVGFLLISIANAKSAEAATTKKIVTPPYRASIGDRSTNFLQAEPKQTISFWIEITNTGKKTWKATGSNMVALNAVYITKKGSLDVNRKTALYDKSWGTIVRPVKLTKDVKPGEKVRLSFKFRTPNRVGEFREKFSLAVKGVDFMPQGNFEVLVRSGNPTTAQYRVDPGLASAATFTMPKGKSKTFELTVTNTGTQTWKRRGTGEVVLASALPSGTISKFYYPFWYGKTTLGRLTTSEVKPGKKGTFRFALQAPDQYGLFTEQVEIIRPDLTRMVDGLFTLGVNIPSPDPVVQTLTLGTEPLVRIGITPVPNPAPTTGAFQRVDGNYALAESYISLSNPSGLTITDSAGATAFIVPANTPVKLQYANGVYTATLGEQIASSTLPLRAIPIMASEISTIANLSWATINNQFRGTLELRFASATGKVWLIEEVPIEQYVAGLGESGDSGPTEFLKTMSVAARTYVLFHHLEQRKHASENYDLKSTSSDQVYYGYSYEKKMPNFGAAVLATRGIVATHPAAVTTNDQIGTIVTAYSSCSDGRTRSFSEVWNGDPTWFPYLVSVPDAIGKCTTPPYPASYLTGGGGNHMVGMSAFGAVKYARDQGKTYDWILKNYYTGITLQQVYP